MGSRKENVLLNVGIVSFFILITIGFATTSNMSHSVISSLRYIAGITTLLSIAGLIIQKKIYTHQFLGIGMYFILIFIGLLLSLKNNAINIGIQYLETNFIIILLGLILFSFVPKDRPIIPNHLSIILTLYILIMLTLTIGTGGLELNFPPQFIFGYITENANKSILYSQGISKFFGYGAIISAFMIKSSKSKIYTTATWIFLLIIFTGLTLLGGARGETIGCVFIVLVYLIHKTQIHKIIIISTALITAGFIFIKDWDWINQLIILNRLSSLTENLGQRDVLIAQSGRIFAENPTCLFSGCGFGFFQSYYRYDLGLYPHNILAEFTLTFGLPLTLVIGTTILFGITAYTKKQKKVDILMLLFFYSLLIDLKSGYLLSGWITTIFAIHFASQHIDVLRKKHLLHRK
jgi:hypothetical protein